MAQKGLGRRVAEARQHLRMSQRELAEAAGITEQALSRVENGVREPKVETVVKLARALRVTTSDLIEGDGSLEPAMKYRPEVEEVARLLNDVPLDTVRLAARVVEVLVENGARAARQRPRRR